MIRPNKIKRIHGEEILTSQKINHIIKRIEYLAYLMNVPSLFRTRTVGSSGVGGGGGSGNPTFFGARGSNNLFTHNIPPGGTPDIISNIYDPNAINTTRWFNAGVYSAGDISMCYVPVSPKGIVVTSGFNLSIRYIFGATNNLLLSVNGPKIILNKKFKEGYQSINFGGFQFPAYWSRDNWTFDTRWRGATAASRSRWSVTADTRAEFGFNT